MPSLKDQTVLIVGRGSGLAEPAPGGGTLVRFRLPVLESGAARDRAASLAGSPL